MPIHCAKPQTFRTLLAIAVAFVAPILIMIFMTQVTRSDSEIDLAEVTWLLVPEENVSTVVGATPADDSVVKSMFEGVCHPEAPICGQWSPGGRFSLDQVFNHSEGSAYLYSRIDLSQRNLTEQPLIVTFGESYAEISLWINGTFVGRSHRHQRIDEKMYPFPGIDALDVPAGSLRSGEVNLLVVQLKPLQNPRLSRKNGVRAPRILSRSDFLHLEYLTSNGMLFFIIAGLSLGLYHFSLWWSRRDPTYLVFTIWALCSSLQAAFQHNIFIDFGVSAEVTWRWRSILFHTFPISYITFASFAGIPVSQLWRAVKSRTWRPLLGRGFVGTTMLILGEGTLFVVYPILLVVCAVSPLETAVHILYSISSPLTFFALIALFFRILLWVSTEIRGVEARTAVPLAAGIAMGASAGIATLADALGVEGISPTLSAFTIPAAVFLFAMSIGQRYMLIYRRVENLKGRLEQLLAATKEFPVQKTSREIAEKAAGWILQHRRLIGENVAARSLLVSRPLPQHPAKEGNALRTFSFDEGLLTPGCEPADGWTDGATILLQASAQEEPSVTENGHLVVPVRNASGYFGCLEIASYPFRLLFGDEKDLMSVLTYSLGVSVANLTAFNRNKEKTIRLVNHGRIILAQTDLAGILRSIRRSQEDNLIDTTRISVRFSSVCFPSEKKLEPGFYAVDAASSPRRESRTQTVADGEIQGKTIRVSELHNPSKHLAFIDVTEEMENQEAFIELLLELEVLSNFVASAITGIRLMHSLRQVELANREINTIFNTVPLGIFMMDENYLVMPQHSRFLAEIFGNLDFAGHCALDLLFSSRDSLQAEREQTRQALLASFGESKLSFDFNSHLLPKDLAIEVGERFRHLELDWTPVLGSDDVVVWVMVTCRDVTRERNLREASAATQLENNMILEVVGVPRHTFYNHIKSASLALSSLRAAAQQGRIALKDAEHLKVELHTLKGNSRTLNLQELTSAIHNVEGAFIQWAQVAIAQDGEVESRQQQLLAAVRTMRKILANYEDIAQNRLGWSKSETENARNRIRAAIRGVEVLRKQMQGDSAARGQLLAIHESLVALEYPSLASRIKALQQMLKGLAQELDVPAPRVNLHNPQLWYLEDKIDKAIIGALTHVFRNALDHGFGDLPPDAQRVISVDAVMNGSDAVIRVTDSGRGLNIPKLRQIATANGMLKDANADEAEVAECLFLGGASTREQVSLVSGRGIGMGAVRRLLGRLDGHARILLTGATDSEGRRPFVIELVFPGAGLIWFEEADEERAA